MAGCLSHNHLHLTTFNTLPSSHHNINPYITTSITYLTFPSSKSSSLLELRCSRRTRGFGSSIVTRAGPTTNQFIFAFVFPLSLLAITVFTAFQVGNRLDQKFLEELAINEAMREEEEEFTGVVTPKKEEPALPPSRNRPRREV
ncbi:hypothetical protein KSS87_013863 [Heliosperma pusillum]|nr:hypothetical protein KSS87_013863 [Heliosperma pusillum]